MTKVEVTVWFGCLTMYPTVYVFTDDLSEVERDLHKLYPAATQIDVDWE